VWVDQLFVLDQERTAWALLLTGSRLRDPHSSGGFASLIKVCFCGIRF
jgi:hypothetical protein